MSHPREFPPSIVEPHLLRAMFPGWDEVKIWNITLRMATMKRTPAPEWRDDTGYSRNDKQRTARVWKLGAYANEITVHRLVGCDGWFVTCHALGIRSYPLTPTVLHEAQTMALILCTTRLAELVDGFALIGVLVS